MTARRIRLALGVAATIAIGGPLAHRALAAEPVTAEVSVCFTPPSGCAEQIVAAINGARQEILAQVYEFTSRPIADALIAAKQRGVDVRIILNKENTRDAYSKATYVAKAGIPLWIDSTVAIAHNKLIIIDENVVVGGSQNYSASSFTRNAENATISYSGDLAAQFVANWQARLAVSQPWSPGP